MARLDSSEFQRLMYTQLQPRLQNAEPKALAALDGLLVRGLAIGSALRGEQMTALTPGLAFSLVALGIVTLVVLLSTWLYGALTLRPRGSQLALGQPGVSSYDEHLQTARSPTLILRPAGSLFFGLSNAPALFPRL